MSLKHCTVATLTYYAICYSTVHFNSIPILQGPGTLEQCTKTEGSCTLQQYPIIQCRCKQLTLLCIVLERCDCILYFCTGSVVTIVSFTLCKVLILCNCILYCIVLVHCWYSSVIHDNDNGTQLISRIPKCMVLSDCNYRKILCHESFIVHNVLLQFCLNWLLLTCDIVTCLLKTLSCICNTNCNIFS